MPASTSSRRAAAFACALALSAVTRPSLRAEPPADGVVARVGDRTITVAELERKLASVPPFQLRAFGATPEEIRRSFLERVLVRDALLVEGARAQKLDERPDVQDLLRRQLRVTLLAGVRQEVLAKPVTDEEVKAYYDANRAKYNAPERVAIWRILAGTREDAAALLDEVKKDLTPKRWNELAREKSLDKTTSMRGGNLGFVAPDGATAEPGIKVDPALFVAVQEVKDGELVGRPVAEGDRFAVVWRRQSMKPINRSIEGEAPGIRQVLLHAKTEARSKELVASLRKEHASDLHPEASLRKEHASDLHPELVDLLDVSSSGEIAPVRRPGTLPSSRRPSAGSPAPAPGPGGLR